jgi:HEAT repeat protein
VYEALRAAGTNAVPLVIARLKRDNRASRFIYQPLQQWAPTVFKRLTRRRPLHPYTQAKAEVALDIIGPASIPVLKSYLSDHNVAVRQTVMTALNLFLVKGNDLKPVQPELIYAIMDTDGYVRGLSIYTLAVMCPNRRAAWASIATNITASSMQSRPVERDPTTAVPILTNLIVDNNPGVRAAAQSVLRQIDSKAGRR